MGGRCPSLSFVCAARDEFLSQYPDFVVLTITELSLSVHTFATSTLHILNLKGLLYSV